MIKAREESLSNDIEDSSTSDNTQRDAAAGELTNTAMLTGNEPPELHRSQAPPPVQTIGQEIHHHYYLGPETLNSLHQLPSQPSLQKAKQESRDEATREERRQ